MKNGYSNLLNERTANFYKEYIVSDIQNKLKYSTKVLNEDIFDLANKINPILAQTENLDVNMLLKYYILNEILHGEKSKTSQSKENIYEETFNPNIKKSKLDNKYYLVTNEQYTLLENVAEICEDGSYIKIEEKKGSTFKVKNKYNTENNLVSIQLISPQGIVINDKWQVAEILGMRKEFAKRYKYTGFSGNSKDLMADILNNFFAPIETGHYLDSNYKIFKWNMTEKAFIRNFNAETQSPLLADYEFHKQNIVIKKEYTGVLK